MVNVLGYWYCVFDGYFWFVYFVVGGDVLWFGGGFVLFGLLVVVFVLVVLCLCFGFVWCLELWVDGGF